MSGWLPEIEGWVKLAGILVGVVMAVLVPVRSWIVEERRHRARLSEPADSGVAEPNRAAIGELAAALRDCAAAIRFAARAARRRDAGRRERLIERLLGRD